MEKNKMLEIVDDFVEHYYDGDYEISRYATSIGTRLSDALQSYVEAKSDIENVGNQYSEQYIFDRAKECLKHITTVRRLGYVKETLTLSAKLNKAVELLKESDEKNGQLRDENGKLQKEVLRLKKLNEALHKTIDKLGAKRHNGGSLGDN